MRTFVHRLNLALSLVDTLTGFPVDGAQLDRDGVTIHPSRRTGGTYLMPEPIEEAFTLRIRVDGYMDKYLTLSPEEIAAMKMPQLMVVMVPSARYPRKHFTIEGERSDLVSVQVVRMAQNHCLVREFDPRRRKLTLLSPHKLALERLHYAVLNPDDETFEYFQILDRPREDMVKVDRVLEQEIKNYYPLCPVLFGEVAGEGRYVLRLPDDSDKPVRWSVRYVYENGSDAFETIETGREVPPTGDEDD